jgi:type IV pilus assembly protein PilW
MKRTHHALSSPTAPSHRQRGMTLVELMVAMLLGLITTFFIAQVLAVAEGQKRTATFGTDAQVNGAVALHTLRRHVQNAGYGVASVYESWGCPIKGEYGTPGSTTAAPAMSLSPIAITRSATASQPSDSVTLMASTKSSFAAPVRITQSRDGSAGQAASFKVDGSLGVKLDDVILAMPKNYTAAGGNCTLFTVKQDTASPDTTLDKDYIPHVVAGSASSWNAAASSVWPTGGFKVDDVIVNFGKLRQTRFEVNLDNNFQATTWLQDGPAAVEQLNSGIVLLKALYGRDTDNDGTVDTYDTATPATNVDWQTVLAVRVVMVARSGQREKDNVTLAEPTWDIGSNVAASYIKTPGSAVTVCAAGAGACQLPLPLNHVSDWQHYRYKVFDTAIPLRNMLWNGG